jgi:hypothetical protein
VSIALATFRAVNTHQAGPKVLFPADPELPAETTPPES